jgi:hypothetical protein
MCLIPAYHPTKHVYIPVSRTGKRVTLMAVIAADRFQTLCRTNRMVSCYFPPHRSNQLHPVDLSRFGMTTRHIARANTRDALNLQSKHIASVVCAFLAAAVRVKVVRTFANSGICLVAIASSASVPRCRDSRYFG